MRGKLGSTVVALFLLVSGTAYAQTYDWATCQPSGTLSACGGNVRSCCSINPTSTTAGTNASVIIAMDRCHQQMANNDAPVTGAPGSNNSQGWCSDPNPYNVNGLFYAYGLVYRLMQNGIKVYWIINPTKSATGVTAYQTTSKQIFNPKEVDAWVLSNGANPPLPTDPLTTCGAGCTPPVKMIDKSTMTGYVSTWTYTKQQFPLKGGAFLIAAADRVNFNKFMLHQSPYPALGTSTGCGQSGNDCYNFSDVTLYEVQTGAHFAWQDYTAALVAGAYAKTDNQLPVGMTIDYKPPRVARLGSTNSVATSWLATANLDQPATNATCGSTTFSPSDAVYCNVSEADMIANKLVTGGFGWAWIDKQSFSDCTNAMLKLKAFMTGVPGTWYAGHVMFNESGVQTVEECTNHQILGKPGAGGSGGTGLSAQSTSVSETGTQPFMIRYPQNLFVQWGDLPLIMASGSVTYWTTDATHQWNPAFSVGTNTLKRLITQENTKVAGTNTVCSDSDNDGSLGDNNTQDNGEIPHSSTSAISGTACDYSPNPSNANSDRIEVATYGRYNNDVMNGVAFYTPGNQLSNKPAELRILLNSLIATPYGSTNNTPTSTYEITRANPVTATVDGAITVVQGTYDYYDPVSSPTTALVDEEVAGFVFPYRTGHLRAIVASSSTNTTYSGVASGSLKFDAAAHIPPSTNTLAGTCTFPKSSSNATCRTIFTNNGTTRVMFNTATPADRTFIHTRLKSDTSLSAASLDTLMSKIVAGNFGGVSRSTAAVIEASAVIPNGRAKMAYVGGHDGMLHAICAEVNAAKGCDELGRELWAFMPANELPFVVKNLQRVDGSPRVMDVYDYFGGSTKTWKTLLMFHTGIGDYASAYRVPALYALDISDPTNPQIQWVYSEAPQTNQPTYAMGQGLTLAAGRVNFTSGAKNVVFMQTNNGGSGTAGVLLYAIDMNDGTKIPSTQWASNPLTYTYSPNPHTNGHDALAASAIPGGAVPIDRTGTNYVTDVVFTTPYGGLWMVDAKTGVSQVGAGKPLMQTTSDWYPIGAKPAVFEQTGTQYAALVTGGYADPSDTTWPMDCKDTVGSKVCAQNSNQASGQVLPIQYALAVKLVTTATAPVGTTFPVAPPSAACGGSVAACTSTIFKFRKDLGQDERGYSQPLVVGDEIFFNVDTEDVNRNGYGTTGSNQGKFYGLNTSGTVTQNGLAIINGASSVANNAGNLFSGSGTKLKYDAAASSTNGTSVKITASGGSGVSRKLWLRAE